MSPWPTSGEGLAAECADPIRVTNRVHFVTQSRRPRLATGVRIQPAIAAPGRSAVGGGCTLPGAASGPKAPSRRSSTNSMQDNFATPTRHLTPTARIVSVPLALSRLHLAIIAHKAFSGILYGPAEDPFIWTGELRRGGLPPSDQGRSVPNGCRRVSTAASRALCCDLDGCSTHPSLEGSLLVNKVRGNYT